MSRFHHIRLELAREPGRPEGDGGDGWDLVAPLDPSGKLDLAACRAEPDRCHIRRFHDNATVATGRLRHGPGDRWILDLDGGDAMDATGFRLGQEHFIPGEYVSLISGKGETHTYGVVRLAPMDVDASAAPCR